MCHILHNHILNVIQWWYHLLYFILDITIHSNIVHSLYKQIQMLFYRKSWISHWTFDIPYHHVHGCTLHQQHMCRNELNYVLFHYQNGFLKPPTKWCPGHKLDREWLSLGIILRVVDLIYFLQNFELSTQILWKYSHAACGTHVH